MIKVHILYFHTRNQDLIVKMDSQEQIQSLLQMHFRIYLR